MDNLFSTHPSTENRIAALEELSREMGLRGFDGPPARDKKSQGPWG
jgi:heat shock protein HtpX